MRCSGFSDAEICRMSSDFIIAAADTTSYTILWCLHLLATHQQQQVTVLSQSNLTFFCVNEGNQAWPFNSKLNSKKWKL